MTSTRKDLELSKVKTRLTDLLEYYAKHVCEKEEILNTLQGWNAYAMQGNTYKLRQRLATFVKSELQKRNTSNH